MKDEIKEIITRMASYTIHYDCCSEGDAEEDIDKLLDCITNLKEKVEYNDLVLKALHRYFTEHECYETHEFLRQLESCTENDMIWLKRMAGVNDE